MRVAPRVVAVSARDRSPGKRASRRFSRSKRLLKAREYSRVFRESCRFSDRLLTTLVSRNGLEQPRLGLAIAKKHIKRAVQRNRIKRIVRESFRRRQDGLHGLDVVVLGSKQLEGASSPGIRRALEQHWIKARQRCNVS